MGGIESQDEIRRSPELAVARVLGDDAGVSDRSRNLRELALLFLKLGTTAFGGPAAHIAMMEDEVVRRRRWLTREEFLDQLGAASLIPGPNSTELALHVGRSRAGLPGLLVAGACFIFPAMAIVMGLGWAYVTYGSLPELRGALYGVKPVIVAIVIQAMWGLARTAVRSAPLAGIGLASAGLSLLRADELLVLLAAGAAALAAGWARAGGKPASSLLVTGTLAATGAPLLAGTAAGTMPFSLSSLFAVFFKVGAVLYGSGYVLLAFLRTDLVVRLGWLSEAQLLDAAAVGQVTPGPVFTTATFVGYILGGPGAALVATTGIFLPAFVFVALSGPLVPRLRRSPRAGFFLDGVNVASLGLMAAVSWHLGRDAIMDFATLFIAAASLILLLRYRASSAWLVVGGAIAGSITFGLGQS